MTDKNPTELFESETARHRAAGFEAKPGWTRRLMQRAESLRGTGRYQHRPLDLRKDRSAENPFWPGISCAACETKMAIEASFYCEDCEPSAEAVATAAKNQEVIDRGRKRAHKRKIDRLREELS